MTYTISVAAVYVTDNVRYKAGGGQPEHIGRGNSKADWTYSGAHDAVSDAVRAALLAGPQGVESASEMTIRIEGRA